MLVNHYPLVREPTRVLRHPEFAQWCGTERTADWHVRFRAARRRLRPPAHPAHDSHDGVRFEEVSLGYPEERDKRPDRPRGLKQILPAARRGLSGRRPQMVVCTRHRGGSSAGQSSGLIIRRCGSWRVKVYAGTDPLTGREIRLRKTCKTEQAAQIELGKLLAKAQAGRQPDSAVTVAQLLDQYVSTAGWDVSTRESNLGYIRRTIKPALGPLQVRKVRGPILDTLYARLMRCGNLACTGKPFTEHRNIPDLRPDPADRRLEWEQAADRVRQRSAPGN